MKKLLIIFTLLSFVFLFVFCGDDDDDAGSDSDTEATSDIPEAAEGAPATTATTGGTVTLTGNLYAISAAIPAYAKNIHKHSSATIAANYFAHVLDTSNGDQAMANVGSDGSFSFTLSAGTDYIINFLDDAYNYIGTLATGAASESKIPVALTTGSDGSTTDLGTITASTTTGQVISDQTLESSTSHMASATSDNIIAGAETEGEGTTNYDATTITDEIADATDPDDDNDGVPDVFDTDNDNNGYSDEIDGHVDKCIPGDIALYIENYVAGHVSGDQIGFPTDDEVDADLASNTNYVTRLEFTPGNGNTMDDISEVAISGPAYLDDYAYVYSVPDTHACFTETLWEDCNGKKLLVSTDGTKFEMGLSDGASSAALLENTFPGDTFVYYITMTDETIYTCTKKINIIPKYFAYHAKYADGASAVTSGADLIDTDATVQTDWTAPFTLSWSISDRAPTGQTYEVRIIGYSACDTWDPEIYNTVSAGQDGTSVTVTAADLPASTPQYWSFGLYNLDSAGDLSYTTPVNFTDLDSNPCSSSY